MTLVNISMGSELNEFRKISKIIFPLIKNSCNTLDEESQKAVSTMITTYEMIRYPDSNIKKITERAEKYIYNIAEYLKTYSLPNSLDSWILLLTIATNQHNTAISTNPVQTKITDNKSEDSLEDIILQGTIKEIQRKISNETAPGIHSVLKREILKICISKGTKEVDSRLLGIIIKNKSLIIENIKKLTKNILVSHIFHSKFLKSKSNSNLRNRLLKAILKRAIAPILQQHSYIDLKRLFPAAFQVIKSIVVRHFNLKANSDRAKKAEQAKQKNIVKESPLYSMLHSHDPCQEVKLPNIIANNDDIKKETARLKALGISHVNAVNKADHDIKEMRCQSITKKIDKIKAL